MVLNRKIFVVVLHFLIGFYSCQKVYEPEDIESGLKIPVVIGQITNGQGPHWVNMYYALPYNSEEINYEAITGAKVSIASDSGDYAFLQQVRTGYYVTRENQLVGKPGIRYWLRIELGETVFESTPSLMHQPQEIDRTFAEYGDYVFIDKNVYGEIVPKNQRGIYLYLDMDNLNNEARFFRFTFDYVAQKMFYIGMPPLLTPVRTWAMGRLNKEPVANPVSFNGEGYFINRFNFGFMHYQVEVMPYEDSTYEAKPMGWVIISNAMAVSEEAFNYYNAINIQLEAKDRIFDPIASQIPGNIKCLTDSTKTVFGIFEVASVATTYSYHYWVDGLKSVINKKLDSYTKPDSIGFVEGIPPSFWVEP